MIASPEHGDRGNAMSNQGGADDNLITSHSGTTEDVQPWLMFQALSLKG